MNLVAVSKEKYRPKKSNEEDEKKSEKRNDSKREMKAMEAIKIGGEALIFYGCMIESIMPI